MRYVLPILLFTTVPAAAQMQMACDDQTKIDTRLSSEFGESITSAGITPGGVMYVTSNPESGTFTVVLRREGGQACILIGGIGYATTDPVPVKQGKDL